MKKLNIFLSALAVAAIGLTSCGNDKEMPPVAFPDGGSEETIGSGTWDDPYSVWQALAGTEMAEGVDGVWVTGYIVGYINTFDGDYAKLREKSAVFSAVGAPNSNLLLAMTPEETDWEKCIPVQLAYGTSGRDLSLGQHPEYLHRQVTLYGETGNKYLSVYGLRGCSNYNWGPEGIYMAPPRVFNKATELNSGDVCLMVASNKYIAQNLSETYTYGYLYCDETTGGASIKGKLSNSYTFVKEGDYWIITDSYGRYVYQNDSAQNFQVSVEMPASNYLWSVQFNADGTALITNVSRGTWIQYDPNYSSYGCYNSERGVMPVLYVLQPEEE